MLVHMPEKKPATPAPESIPPNEQPSTAAHPPLPDEYDRRGIKLPARTLVGGVITPA